MPEIPSQVHFMICLSSKLAHWSDCNRLRRAWEPLTSNIFCFLGTFTSTALLAGCVCVCIACWNVRYGNMTEINCIRSLEFAWQKQSSDNICCTISNSALFFLLAATSCHHHQVAWLLSRNQTIRFIVHLHQHVNLSSFKAENNKMIGRVCN